MTIWDTEPSAEEEANIDRYMKAAHAMQSGVAAKMRMDPKDTEPKHLRVGVNAAMVEHSALAQLLLKKGIITREEYTAELADVMEEEARKYTEERSEEHTS